jgi:DNA polymerase-3 subunit chi
MIFDGHNEEALAQARGFWKSVKAAELPATYWKQSESGRWEKQG